MTRRCDVAVVGAGIAGLAAAWRLRDLDVVVLEAAGRNGGRICSEPRGDLWLNFGAHVFSGPDSASGRLISELGVDARELTGTLAAVSLRGRLVARGPVELYPFRLPLTRADRLALVRAGLRLRLAVRRYARVAAARSGESAAARQERMLRFGDDRTFSQFIGDLPPDVDGILRSTLTRSSGEPEELAAGYGIGYFHLVWNRREGLSRSILGGSGRLVEALSSRLGARIEQGAEVLRVTPGSGGVVIAYRRGGREQTLQARAAVVATPAYVTRGIVDGLPRETCAALEAIPYGPYVVGAFLTGERSSMPWDGVYAVATPGRSFSMLFNTANVVREEGAPRGPGGSLMVYAAASAARRLLELDDDEIAARFRDDLGAVLPQAPGLVVETQIRRWPRGLPYPRAGRLALQRPLTASLGPVFLAGDYLGTWYTETAAQTAEAAAAGARRTVAEAAARG